MGIKGKTNQPAPGARNGEAGFSMAEFLIASLILLIISTAIFTMMGETQRDSSYQTEVQTVLQNVRIAMDSVERYIRQAGNNPLKIAGFQGVVIIGATQVQLVSDLTGSSGGSNPDKGDPDGDTLDAGEDVTIRHNAGTLSIELVPNGQAAQTIADHISNLTMDYYDATGTVTAVGANVCKIRVTIAGASTLENPQTHQIYGVQIQSDVQIQSRN